MKFQYKVTEVTHREDGRTAQLRPHNPTGDSRAYWEGAFSLKVPPETFCEPGDIVTIEVQWAK